MAPRPKATIKTAANGRKADGTTNTTQREQSDRRELSVVARQQQRTKFSRQSSSFASTGELSYY